MRSNPTRLILPLALLASLCACSAQVSTDEDGTEQEQALSSAQQAAETAATPAPAPVAGVEPPVPACDASQAEALVASPSATPWPSRPAKMPVPSACGCSRPGRW